MTTFIRTFYSLASLTHFCKRREGSGEPRIQAVSCRTVQCSTITLQYFITWRLHHCLSSNSSLENGESELGHLSRYCRSWKNTLTILLGECAYSAKGNSRVQLFEIWLHHPANCIPAGHSLYTQFTRPFPSLQKWVRLVRLDFLPVHSESDNWS